MWSRKYRTFLLLILISPFVSGKEYTIREYPYGGVKIPWSQEDADTNRLPWEVLNYKVLRPPLIFTKKVDFKDSIFKKQAYFRKAKFEKNAYFYTSHFNEQADFLGSNFKKYAGFIGCVLKGSADFRNTTFNYSAFFSLAQFERDFLLDDVEFQSKADLTNIYVKGEFSLEGVKFGKENFFARIRVRRESGF